MPCHGSMKPLISPPALNPPVRRLNSMCRPRFAIVSCSGHKNPQETDTRASTERHDWFNSGSGGHPRFTMWKGVKESAGRRANGYEVESLDGTVRITLPSLIECNDFPNNRDEIPTPDVARHHAHLKSVAHLIPDQDPQAPIMLLLGWDVIRVHKVRKQMQAFSSTKQRSCFQQPHLPSPVVSVSNSGLWNCQSAVRNADFISALASHYSFDFLALTETWISPQNTATPAALSSAYTFSHSPRESVSVTSLINLFIIVIYRPPGPPASCTLSSPPDHEAFSSLPLDSATDTLLSSLSSTMDLLCPLSTIHKKNSSTASWLSDVLRNNQRELRSAARKWKKSKLDTDLISYRTLLSKFSLDVTSAKTPFYKETLETSAQDPRKLHNNISSLLNPPAPPSPSSLTA
ncbi:hypothetical protein QTP70_004880 [Hemibagrus guttatus]|uniref:Uncharacterized protein n=1 Tax=Hemibagrus guttatus TaxID=175788 RepID=A0AAE0VBD2_9TELE|nr:hypothetical protein QTP70_004880 [Hemibagrus guttatus]